MIADVPVSSNGRGLDFGKLLVAVRMDFSSERTSFMHAIMDLKPGFPCIVG